MRGCQPLYIGRYACIPLPPPRRCLSALARFLPRPTFCLPLPPSRPSSKDRPRGWVGGVGRRQGEGVVFNHRSPLVVIPSDNGC